MLGVVRNVARQHIRKRTRREGLLGEYREDVVAEAGYEPARDYRRDEVLELTKRLPKAQRKIIRCTLDGMTTGEIADKLEMKRGTVRVYRHRAIAALRGLVRIPGEGLFPSSPHKRRYPR